jgi:F-type H+-transporting ATPase subunit delta
MKVSKQCRQDAKALFRSCLVNGLLDDNRVRRIVDEVLAAKPRGYLATLAQFERLVTLEVERRSVRVESAAPLDPATETAIRNNLQRQYGAGLNFTFAVVPELIGGMRIKVASDVFDGTVRGRLNRLREDFETA